MPDTIPPANPPVTPAITPSPPGPGANETIDPSQTDISPQVRSLQRMMYELNADLARGTIVVPTDLNIAAGQVLELQGFGVAIDGNWLIETHRLSLSGAEENALSELIVRKCQDVAALYAVPGGGLPSAQQTTDVQSPGGIRTNQGPESPGVPANQGPETIGG